MQITGTQLTVVKEDKIDQVIKVRYSWIYGSNNVRNQSLSPLFLLPLSVPPSSFPSHLSFLLLSLSSLFVSLLLFLWVGFISLVA